LKHLEDVEHFKYLGCMILNDKNKSRITMEKAAFNKGKFLFTSKLKLNLRKELVKFYIWN
jgi:hypothetical protein